MIRARGGLFWALALLPMYGHAGASVDGESFIRACKVTDLYERGAVTSLSAADAKMVGFCDGAIQSYKASYFRCSYMPGMDLSGFVRTAEERIAALEKRIGPAARMSNFTDVLADAFSTIPIKSRDGIERCAAIEPGRLLFGR